VGTVREVLVPDIGDFQDVDVIEILVGRGEAIEKEQSLIVVESDKATMEIPAPRAGVVQSLEVNVGDKISEGSLILNLAVADVDAPTDGNGKPEQIEPMSVPEQPEASEPSENLSPAAETQQVTVPDIGDFQGVEIIEVLVEPGERIELDQSLITVESDKATMEIPSPFSGEVVEVLVNVGEKVSEGLPIATVRAYPEPGETPAPTETGRPSEALARSEPAEEETRPVDLVRRPGEKVAAPPPVRGPVAKGGSLAHASPSIRRFARELGVDLALVRGTGPKGRILQDDVHGFVKAALGSGPAPSEGAFSLPGIPVVDFARFGEVQVQPLSRIKKISGAHLHRCWLNVPHVTQYDEADMTQLEAFRKSMAEDAAKRGVKLTSLVFMMKASVAALREYPTFNASLDATGESLVLKRYYHIGVAVDTPEGLMVPVVRDVDKKGLYELAGEVSELAGRAREGKLTPAQMQGGCFSISSLGGIGGSSFTPIVNAPEVAILGVSRAQMKPVYQSDGSFRPGLMLPLSLSYDHRVIDGAAAARFTSFLSAVLTDVRRLLL